MALFSSTSIQPQRPNWLAHALETARHSGVRLLDLTTSNPTTCGIAVPNESILSALASPESLVYQPDALGLLDARVSVAATYAESYRPDPNRILLTSSTSEGYGYLLKLLCDPGDSILVPEPGYPLLDHLAQLEHVTLLPYRLAYDGRWYVDLASARRMRRADTKAIVVVSPNNPTGNVLSDGELHALSELRLPIIADEVFTRFSLSGEQTDCPSVLRYQDSLRFSLGGLSKSCAMPQLKLAWITVGGPELDAREAMQRLGLIADTYLSVATPVQLALPRLLEIGKSMADAIRQRLSRNLASLHKFARNTACTVLHVEAGWYAILRVPSLMDEDAWVRTLLLEDGVYVHPGWFFDFAHSPHLVVSLLTPEEEFDAGIARVVQRAADLCVQGAATVHETQD